MYVYIKQECKHCEQLLIDYSMSLSGDTRVLTREYINNKEPQKKRFSVFCCSMGENQSTSTWDNELQMGVL